MIRWWHARHIGAAALPVCLLAVSLLLATTSASHSPHRQLPPSKPEQRLVLPATPRTSQQRATSASRLTAEASFHPGSPRAVALTFTHAWLSCTYHQQRCTRIPGALPAYTAALHRQHATSLPTPAELATRQAIRTVNVVQACGDEAVATVTYVAGQVIRYQLHINLVRRQATWWVFDIAEASPHIPLPAPLGRGPDTC